MRARERLRKAAPHRQIEVIQTLNRNRSRAEALVELYKEAKTHVPHSLKGTPRVVGRDGDGSFWILPKEGKRHAPSPEILFQCVSPAQRTRITPRPDRPAVAGQAVQSAVRAGSWESRTG
ncbi:hypothetical protein GCM10020367_06180 [Streptomyces sannanensis]|uniref:Uncharacterized protein n=1 Tax=Streptomyces sannanensis TaxID=285536 RepID=A0ABP6S4Z5_9ACTN